MERTYEITDAAHAVMLSSLRVAMLSLHVTKTKQDNKIKQLKAEMEHATKVRDEFVRYIDENAKAQKALTGHDGS